MIILLSKGKSNVNLKKIRQVRGDQHYIQGDFTAI